MTRSVSTDWQRLFHCALSTMFALTATELSAATADQAWTPNDLVQMERITDLDISPANPSVVVWVKSAPDKEKDEYVAHLFRSDEGRLPAPDRHPKKRRSSERRRRLTAEWQRRAPKSLRARQVQIVYKL
jgi:hypothetical protein